MWNTNAISRSYHDVTGLFVSHIVKVSSCDAVGVNGFFFRIFQYLNYFSTWFVIFSLCIWMAVFVRIVNDVMFIFKQHIIT